MSARCMHLLECGCIAANNCQGTGYQMFQATIIWKRILTAVQSDPPFAVV